MLMALLFASVHVAVAQSAHKQEREAANLLKNNEPARAEALYRNILNTNPNDDVAAYGLGNALYNQKKYKEAAQAYGKIDMKNGALTIPQMADVAHNMGNAFMKEKAYDKAAECYKQSLRLRPEDDETRYNLALALKLLQQQQNQQNQQNQQQNNKNNQQQDNKDKQNKDNNKDKQKDQQNKPSDNKDKQQQPPQQPQQQPQEIDPQTAKQILNSFQQDDDNTRKKFEMMEKQKKAQPSDPNKKQW